MDAFLIDLGLLFGTQLDRFLIQSLGSLIEGLAGQFKTPQALVSHCQSLVELVEGCLWVFSRPSLGMDTFLFFQINNFNAFRILSKTSLLKISIFFIESLLYICG